MALEEDGVIDFSYLDEIRNLSKPKETKNDEPKSKKARKEESHPAPNRAAIKAVLDKKKQTELKKADTYKKNREDLMALRAQDQKSYNKMTSMLNRINNKGIREEAKELVSVQSEAQCGEDDYGYESTMSQQIFDKLATQYSEIPEDESLKFKKVKTESISDIKNRVLNSLKKDEEKPGKRKRKHQSDEFLNDGDPYDKYLDGDKNNKSPNREEKVRSSDKHSSSSRDKHSSSSRDRDRKEKPKKEEPRMPVNLNLTNHVTRDNGAFKYDYDKKKDEDKQRKEKEIEREREKKKKRFNNLPPAMNFAELLKLAQNKQKASTVMKVEDNVKEKVKEAEKKKLEKSQRPLTAQEKDELDEQRLRKLRRSGKLPNLPTEKLKEMEQRKKNKDVKESIKEEVKKEKGKDKDSSVKDSRYNGKLNNDYKDSEEKKSKTSEKNGKAKEKEMAKPEHVKLKDRSKYFAVPGAKPSASSGASKSILHAKLTESKHFPPPQDKIKSNISSSKLSNANNKFKTPDSKSRLQQQECKPSKSRQFPPPDIRPSKKVSSSKPSLSSSKSRHFPPADMRPSSSGGRAALNRIDSDEDSEYDSEMDDFIDDGDAGLDYSSEIKKMFGYDKSKYRDEDDDCDDMEVGYGQVEREELISAAIGMKEDEEDEKMEIEQKKRKMMMKKKTMMRGGGRR